MVGNAKVISPTIERGVDNAGLPYGVVGVVIALMVLLPETLSAVRSARRDRMQTSLNLAYGSAIASIGLTVPTIAFASIWLSGDLELGLQPVHLVLLALTAVVSALTVVPGRANLLQGGCTWRCSPRSSSCRSVPEAGRADRTRGGSRGWCRGRAAQDGTGAAHGLLGGQRRSVPVGRRERRAAQGGAGRGGGTVDVPAFGRGQRGADAPARRVGRAEQQGRAPRPGAPPPRAAAPARPSSESASARGSPRSAPRRDPADGGRRPCRRPRAVRRGSRVRRGADGRRPRTRHRRSRRGCGRGGLRRRRGPRAAGAERQAHLGVDLAVLVALFGGDAAGLFVQFPAAFPVPGEQGEAAQPGEPGRDLGQQAEFLAMPRPSRWRRAASS
ncbi:hypothetical protein ACFQ60_06205 [Streptomyces zhihengii]